MEKNSISTLYGQVTVGTLILQVSFFFILFGEVVIEKTTIKVAFERVYQG
ncbi:hypothetical protein HanIR_Chr12g0575901 [Helianthus annuus]|nr:hypothetical protein HanIR_Chr12g0575901 [Helianthus annuus]